MKLTTILDQLGFRNDEYLLDCIVFSSFNNIVHDSDFAAIQ